MLYQRLEVFKRSYTEHAWRDYGTHEKTIYNFAEVADRKYGFKLRQITQTNRIMTGRPKGKTRVEIWALVSKMSEVFNISEVRVDANSCSFVLSRFWKA